MNNFVIRRNKYLVPLIQLVATLFYISLKCHVTQIFSDSTYQPDLFQAFLVTKQNRFDGFLV